MSAARKVKGELLSEYGNFSNPKEQKQFAVFNEQGKIVTKKLFKHKHTVTCLKCKYEGPVWKFSYSFSRWHDMRCAQCGTVKLDTSDIKKILGDKYHFGKDNKLEKKYIPKNNRPEFGD